MWKRQWRGVGQLPRLGRAPTKVARGPADGKHRRGRRENGPYPWTGGRKSETVQGPDLTPMLPGKVKPPEPGCSTLGNALRATRTAEWCATLVRDALRDTQRGSGAA